MRCLTALVAFSTSAACGAAVELPANLLGAARLDAWELVATPPAAIASVLATTADGAMAIAGKPVGYLQTKAVYHDYELHLEWRWTAEPGNAGVLLHIDSGPLDRHVWPRCLQVQTKHTRAGDLLPMAGAKFAEPLATGAKTPQRDRLAPSSEKPPGQWNLCDIVCRGDTIEVRVNGVLQNRVTGCVPAAGRIGLQLEGAPYELRAVTLQPLAATAPAP
jgi:hypothetical protein